VSTQAITTSLVALLFEIDVEGIETIEGTKSILT
jgi:hypothetical protein